MYRNNGDPILETDIIIEIRMTRGLPKPWPKWWQFWRRKNNNGLILQQVFEARANFEWQAGLGCGVKGPGYEVRGFEFFPRVKFDADTNYS